ncbi:MAG: c-type cytochrome [Flavobacteriales bacterium]|nr:c-type cytochrome [Flavobacteriales bacterium]
MRSNTKAAAMITLVCLVALLPQKASASNALINGTGLSDETLFIILAVIAIFQLLAILVIAGVIKSIVSNQRIWQMRWNKGAGVMTLLFVLLGSQANAQDGSFDALVKMNDTGFIALIILNLFLFIAFIYLSAKLNGLMKMLLKDEVGKVPESFMDKVNILLTDAVPLEKEEGVLMDHEYDGIRELDNNLPPWWLYGFYFSIVVGVLYFFHYHVTGNGDLQLEEYQAELLEAEEAKAAFVAIQDVEVDENNVDFLAEASDLAAGQKIFMLYCLPCHGESGGSMPGGVGPNLTDDYWINGGSMNDIYKTIKYGVPEKGMVSWQAQLNPQKIQQVSSFIKSLKGTNPENAKEAQGDLWQEEETAETVSPTKEQIPSSDSTSGETESATPDAADDVTLVE